MPGLTLLLLILLFGAVAGWLASLITGGGGGIIRNIFVGLIGSFVGHFVLLGFGVFLPGVFLHALVAAVIGGVIVIVIARALA